MNIAIIYTGGTIGCIGNPLTPMSLSAFQKRFDVHILPIVKTKYSNTSIDFIDFGMVIDSTDILPINWCDITDSILNTYDKYDGYIILHGTDTMAYSSAMVSYLCGSRFDKPVIFTGSQLPLFDDITLYFNSDGLSNIQGAIASIYAGVYGVMVFFHNKLMQGSRIIKSNTQNYDTFSSPNYPVLAQYYLDFEALVPYDAPDKTPSLPMLKERAKAVRSIIMNVNIVQVLAYPINHQFVADLINSYVANNVDAIVLQSFGTGNFPQGKDGVVRKALENANANDILILNNTQVSASFVDSSMYNSGNWLANVGAIDALDMTPIATYTKLLYLISLQKLNIYTKAEIKTLMKKAIAKEINE